MSTTETVSMQFSAKQLAAIDASRVDANTNGSNAGGAQYADAQSYLTYLLSNVMIGACVSYTQQFNLGAIDDLAEGDIGYVAPV